MQIQGMARKGKTASASEEEDILMKTTAKAVVQLTIELPSTHAAELAGLLGSHVSFLDFPWAESIYYALCSEGIRDEDVFRDAVFGESVFLQRRQDQPQMRLPLDHK